MATDTKARPPSLLPRGFAHAWGNTHRGGHSTAHLNTPRLKELAENGRRDWKMGVELIKTCMNTHDTAGCVSMLVELLGVDGGGIQWVVA